MYVMAATTDSGDSAALRSLADEWKNLPPGWLRGDPCRDGWVGIECSGSRVTLITLPSMNLEGELSGDLSILSELQQLDLSYNDLTGPLPSTIGNLKKLTNLSLNSNGFTGTIPPSIGNLSNLYWLDLADNQLEGPIPVSDGSTPGLDMLAHTKHFHFGKNKLSGQIPSKLFSSNMSLIHLTRANAGGGVSISTERFDSNSLSGKLPSNLNNLTNVHELFLSNNRLIGPLPNLTGMSTLSTLMMEDIKLQGQVPATFFELPHLQAVVLKWNRLNGTLVINPSSSNQLHIIDLQNNEISDFNYAGTYSFEIVLEGNPVCKETGKTDTYCKPPIDFLVFDPSKELSADFMLVGPNLEPHMQMCTSIYRNTRSHQVPVETVSLSDPDGFISISSLEPCNQTYKPPSKYFGPYAFDGHKYEHFSDDPVKPKNASLAIKIGAAAGSSVLFLMLMLAGVYVYRQKKKADRVTKRSNPFAHWDSRKTSGSFPQLKGARCFSFEELKKYTNNFSEACDIGSGGYGKYLGSIDSEFLSYRFIEELYQTGELIAIKRAQQGSMQGGLEFKTEIELLSRVHHKNVNILKCREVGNQNGLAKTAKSSPRGLEKYVDVALSCVEESRVDRPAMGEVVKEIENIMQMAGLNPNAESASSSSTYEDSTKGLSHPYRDKA
ncbi:Leucine-rich repeat protein kinase family protein, putative isoform 2 [Hibiscus syriacus]|uniref:Leucine-rich repeat protein kinase family protein, putative isoform 2 n=1 Tax=Hibiscus syriacus TaxID=106335 RepID=A0A6A2ZC58_HIBSY|nr:Leucine-rich repeat protein kinase family protein, putative isoform 2 [Hibiscus syriacus]